LPSVFYTYSIPSGLVVFQFKAQNSKQGQKPSEETKNIRQIAKLLLPKRSARAKRPALGIEADILFAWSVSRHEQKDSSGKPDPPKAGNALKYTQNDNSALVFFHVNRGIRVEGLNKFFACALQQQNRQCFFNF
jgi:hypothetical protein